MTRRDHSIAIGSFAGAAAYFRKREQSLGLIWFDAHADMNTPESTPSGNIHGMPLAASFGLGHEQLTHIRGYSPKVKPENIVIIGDGSVIPHAAIPDGTNINDRAGSIYAGSNEIQRNILAKAALGL